VALVILVVFVFLRNIWATIIPSVAVPLSLVGTFGVMYLCGYSLDNLSLMALTISTGFVVDDAIVVLENITRHIEDGMKPYEAAMQGAQEIGFTVMSMSISLIAVFIPILLMGGIVGRLFREFAVTLSVAIAVSLAVSLSMTPMMSARFLRHDEGKHGWLYKLSENSFDRLLRGYDVCLRWVLRNQAVTLVIFFLTIAVNVELFRNIPKGFFPQQDTGRVNGFVQGDQDISFQSITQKMAQFAEIVQKDPAVDTVSAFTGGGNGTNTARLFMQLKPKSERKLSSDQVIGRLRGKLAKIPGAALYLQSVQDVSVGGRSSGAQYQYTLQGDDLNELTHWAPILMENMRKIPELRDVNSDQQLKGLQAQVIIDRDTANRLGVSMQAIDDTLYDAFGQRQVSVMYQGINQYYVVMEVLPEFQQSPTYLQQVYVASSGGKLVPLSALAHFAPANSALTVNHQGVFPAITLSFNLAPNASLGTAVQDIQRTELRIRMPATIHATFQGTAQAFQDSLSSEPILILAALAAVYIVLGILYESYIHPITILSTLPSAGVGAILALKLVGMDLSIIALIGIILLIGIVKKNAILMIDFALQTERNDKKTAVQAIHDAALMRFRPIMMTTMAALLGAVPLAIGGGDGAELRRPLGVAIVGGLIVSQLLTVFTTPVVYVYLDRLQGWFERSRRRAPVPQPISAHSD
jgi:multidrug efflux pump subunit AcrB